MARGYDVVAIGDAKIDIFFTIHTASDVWRLNQQTYELCFKQGQKIEADRADMCLGGNAANVAVGLSRLGFHTALFAEVGDDEFQLRIHNALAKERVDRVFIHYTSGQPTSFSAIINTGGDRVIISEHVTRKHHFQFEHLHDTKLIFLTSLGHEWEKPYERLYDHLLKHQTPLAFNPGSLQLREGKGVVKKLLTQTELLFLNKEEAEEFLQGKTVKESSNDSAYIDDLMEQLHNLGPKIVVLTNGLYGSHVRDSEGKTYHCPIDKVKAVERTGAGDSYTAAFIGAYLTNHTIEEAMHWGAANSASVVSKIGAQAGLLTKEQI